VLLDDAGIVVARWSSQKRAALALGVCGSQVSLCVRGKQPTANGFRLFRHRDGGCYPSCPSGLETRTTVPSKADSSAELSKATSKAASKAVVLLDEMGNVCREWPSQKMAALELGISGCEVSNCVAGLKSTAKGFRLHRFSENGKYPPCPPGVATKILAEEAKNKFGCQEFGHISSSSQTASPSESPKAKRPKIDSPADKNIAAVVGEATDLAATTTSACSAVGGEVSDLVVRL
jgi:hypothetical protein